MRETCLQMSCPALVLATRGRSALSKIGNQSSPSLEKYYTFLFAMQTKWKERAASRRTFDQVFVFLFYFYISYIFALESLFDAVFLKVVVCKGA